MTIFYSLYNAHIVQNIEFKFTIINVRSNHNQSKLAHDNLESAQGRIEFLISPLPLWGGRKLFKSIGQEYKVLERGREIYGLGEE